MSNLEQSVSKNARILRLDSIRSRILFFAVVATLIPSLSTAWLSYTQNKRSLNSKITEQLESTSRQSSRELELWLKDRLAELRVFAISEAVSENLDLISSRSRGPAVRRMNDYLRSVRERFADYLELMVVDPQGRVIATSARSSRPVQLPTDWTSDITAGRTALGEPYRDEDLGATLLVAAVPIAVPSRRFLGALTAKLSLVDLERTLRDFSLADSGRVYLVTTDGALVTGAAGTGARLTTASMQRLSEQDGRVTSYRNHNGDQVLGSLRRGSEQRLAVVAEIPATAAFREVTRMRNLTMLLVSTLLVGIGLIGYLLGLFIVRPLARLTKGAAKVAAGNLDVDLPVLSGGEVGYLTQVFNNMVVRLREGRQALDAANETLRRKNEELETLSVTDGLTGLHNRRRLMESLADEVRRSQRLKHTFSVLMVDVDHFKKVNDTHGHVAGDRVLQGVAEILKKRVRGGSAFRYGGEEMAVLLPKADLAAALPVAE
ncbi:MAG: sensor domain-containing diguanylate cyclase, partial [Gammaproteobacteria bacterium]